MTTEDQPDESEKKEPPAKKRRRQRKDAAREVSRSGGALQDAVDEFIGKETVKMRDQSHRDYGLWAFDTVNPNAWPGAAEVLATTSADVVLVQEAKIDAASVKDTETTAKNAGWKVSIRECNFGDGGGKSAGVAVACRGCMGMRESCEPHLYPEELRGRFEAKHVGAVCRGGLHACTGYLHDGVGIKHKLNLDWLQAAALS